MVSWHLAPLIRVDSSRQLSPRSAISRLQEGCPGQTALIPNIGALSSCEELAM